MLTRLALIMIIAGFTVFPALAQTDTEAGQTEAVSVQQTERVNLLKQLREAYDNNDRETMGKIIEQMEQRREKMRQRRAEFRSKMKNFDPAACPNEPNAGQWHGRRHHKMRNWKRFGTEEEGCFKDRQGKFKGGRGFKPWRHGHCPMEGFDPNNPPPDANCPMRHKRWCPPPPAEIDEIDEVDET